MDEDQLPAAHRPRSVDVVVRDAVPADIDAMTSVLGSAFAEDDPVGEHLFPDPTVRARRQPRMFSALIRHRFIPQRCALVATIDQRIVGALLWESSRRRFTPIHYATGNVALLEAMRSRVRVGISMDSLLASLVSADASHSHVIGVYLGCLPGTQRRGVGRALTAALIRRCDGNDVTAYLLCKDENVDYYRRLDFEVTARARLGASELEVNVMARAPHPAS